MASRSIDEHALLLALNDTIRSDHVGISQERGKRFYSADRLSPVVRRYLEFWRITKAEFCRRFDISKATLDSILAGRDISDSTLFRLRKAIEAFRYANIEPTDVLTIPGEWRPTNTLEIQNAITDLSNSIIMLLKVIRASNSLNASDAAIDRTQIAQIIALLESALAELKAPYVDVQRQSGLIAWLKRLGKSGFEKGIESKVSEAISDVVEAGTEAIKNMDTSFLDGL